MLKFQVINKWKYRSRRLRLEFQVNFIWISRRSEKEI